MRVVLASLVLLLAGCTAAPPFEQESLVDLDLHGEDVSVAVAAIASVSGREIVVTPGIEHPVIVALHGVPWRQALTTVVKLGLCETVVDRANRIVLMRPTAHHMVVENRDLAELLANTHTGSDTRLVVASDVTEQVSFETDTLRTVADGRRFLRWLIAKFALHAVQVGQILVVSRAPLELELPAGDGDETCTFDAFRAPADGWFALLERLTGRRIDHGRAPLSFYAWEARLDDVVRATALASRVPWPSKPILDLTPLETLPSGKQMALVVQATVARGSEEVVLVNGHVLGRGDHLTSDVQFDGTAMFGLTQFREKEDSFYVASRHVYRGSY